jgi:hypothetical protein
MRVGIERREIYSCSGLERRDMEDRATILDQMGIAGGFRFRWAIAVIKSSEISDPVKYTPDWLGYSPLPTSPKSQRLGFRGGVKTTPLIRLKYKPDWLGYSPLLPPPNKNRFGGGEKIEAARLA